MVNWENNTVKIFLAALLFLLLFLQNGLYTVDSYPDVTITIKTIDNVALPNAIVRAYTVVDENKYLNDTKTTDSSGRVTLSIKEKKIYRLEIFYPSGFLVNVTTSFNYSALPKKELYVNVLSKWTLKITDKFGRDPLPNVPVRIKHPENDSITRTGNTGSDGKVHLNFVPLGMTSSKVYEVNVTYAGQNYIKEAECSERNKEVTIKIELFRVLVAIKDVLNRPVEGIWVEIRRQLDEYALSTGSSNLTGYAVLKLVPNGEYYLTAKLGEYEVYRSEEKIVKVMNADKELSITAQVVRLNVTVYDFDGEAVISNLRVELTGEIRDSLNRLVSTASTLEGELKFGYVPLGKFRLSVSVAGINVYSQEYEIKPETAKGSIRAKFFDAKLTVDGSQLVNSTITKYLKGVLKKDVLEIPLDFSTGYMSIENVPAYSGYLVKLYYKEYEVAEKKIDITLDGEEISIKIRGKNVTIYTFNLYEKPLSAEIKVYLEDGNQYFKFKTDSSGLAETGEFLPITYKFKAYVMDVECGEVIVQPQASESYTIKLNVRNTYIKLYDKDRESTIPDSLIELYTEKSKANSMTNASGIALFENIPLTKYLYRVYMYGFKVGEGVADIGLDRQLLEVVAGGILDLRLTIVDSDRQPVDGGKIEITVGDAEITANIDQNGQVRIPNLPNTTLYIAGLYYKDVKVKTDTREINLISDEMPVTISGSIYTLEASIKLKNGELMKFGEVNIYVSGRKTSKIVLSETNPFIERLPGGELTIEVVFKNVKVASRSFTLDASKGLTLQADVYNFVSTFYNTLGERLEGLSLKIERENTLIEELETDENGMIDTYLPRGVYKFTINYGDQEYSSLIEITDTTQLSFMLPVQVLNPIIIMFLPLVNVLIMSYYFMRKLKTRSLLQKKKPAKTIRKVLKI